MIETYSKILDFLDVRERWNALILFGMMITVGLLNLVGVASIMPFIAMASNPDILKKNTIFTYVYNYFGFASDNNFLIFLGVIFFFLIFSSLMMGLLTQYYLARFVHGRKYSFSSRLLSSYLSRPYSFFLNRHSADLSKSVLSEMEQVVGSALMPAVQLISSLILSLFLIGLLIVVNPLIALSVALVLLIAYATIYLFLRGVLRRLGTNRFLANKERFQIVQEGLGGIKEVKIIGLEETILERYKTPALRLAKTFSKIQILGQFPRFALETIVLGGMVMLILILLILQKQNLIDILPLLGVYALTASRLMPALQNVYGSLAKMRTGKPALDLIHADLIGGQIHHKGDVLLSQPEELSPMALKDKMELKNITFSYFEENKPIINNLSLSILNNTTVALIGPSGSGKSTLVDMMLGLLTPKEGVIEVDGQKLNGSNIRRWQMGLGYVPQTIFLVDDTVSANIALGLSQKEIDLKAVKKAAQIANLHDFITKELPEGYDTKVGERGVRLSGGQRQRLAIARALYRDPSVLILDEATSSLDHETEQQVMQAIKNISGSKTIIMITHRLETTNFCDKIFQIQAGRLTKEV